MRTWKFWLTIALAGSFSHGVFAAEGGDVPLKPSQVTPDMMAKYALKDEVIQKKPNCNDVHQPLLQAFCERPILSEMDAKVRDLMNTLPAKQTQYPQFDLVKDQSEWLVRHDQCLSDKDLKMCLELSYLTRYSELSAQFDLVPKVGPLPYRCGEESVQISFYATELPAVMVRYQDQYRLAYMGPLSRGLEYKSHNLNVVEGKKTATIDWDGKTLRCEQLSVK